MSKSDKGKSPAFQLYAADILVDCMQWDDAMIGLHVKMMCIQWVNHGIEIDSNSVPKGLSKKQKSVFQKIKHKYDFIEGKLYNKRIEETRTEQQENRINQSERGKKGADARWNKQHESNGTSIAKALPNTIQEGTPKNNPSSSTSPSTIKKIKVGERWFDFFPSDFLNENYKMWLDVKMTTMFQGIAPSVILKKFDEKYCGDTFRDDEHVKNAFKKIGEEVKDAKDKPVYYKRAEAKDIKSESQNISW